TPASRTAPVTCTRIRTTGGGDDGVGGAALTVTGATGSSVAALRPSAETATPTPHSNSTATTTRCLGVSSGRRRGSGPVSPVSCGGFDTGSWGEPGSTNVRGDVGAGGGSGSSRARRGAPRPGRPALTYASR